MARNLDVYLSISVFFCQTYKLILIELLKEHSLYRRIFIIGRKGESARWAGLRYIYKRDFSGFFTLNRNKIHQSQESKIYWGKTYFEDDPTLGGRHIGSISDQHQITVAAPGAGKSRDSIWSNLLCYSGGIVCFDPKGEHVKVTAKRRSKAYPVYVVDPYGIADWTDPRSNKKTFIWNPLDEIDPDTPYAREQIKQLVVGSLHIESGESANSSHFRENAQLILRGFIAFVLTDVSLDDKDRHLGTVYDLIKTGDPKAELYSPKAIDKLIKEKMITNVGISGAARDAADLLMRVSEKEAGGYLSTIAKAIDWMNASAVRNAICGESDFSLRSAKSDEASIYLVLPEEYIMEQSRFIATFFSMALNLCGNAITPQPSESEKRTLFLFEEFAKLGHFKPISDKITIARGTFLKFWIICQNIEQITKVYNNYGDFMGSSCMQFFGIKSQDEETLKFISKALGKYVKTTDGNETHYGLLPESDIAEFLDLGSNGQIIFPEAGRPMKLKRIPYYKLFKNSQYGKYN